MIIDNEELLKDYSNGFNFLSGIHFCITVGMVGLWLGYFTSLFNS